MKGRVGRGAVVTVAALAVVLAIALAVAQNDAPANLLDADDGSLVQRGAGIYAAQCAACHGASLEGQPDWRRRRADGRLPAPPHDETGHTWHHPDELLMRMTKYGPQVVAGDAYRSDMPAFEGVLSDADIRAVLSYIKSTWPPDVRRQHGIINEQAVSR